MGDGGEKSYSERKAACLSGKLLQKTPNKFGIYNESFLKVKEGWAPLCKFLELPIPDEPFPRVNDVEQMRARFRLANRIGWGMVIGIPAIFGVIFTWMLS